jgi:non-heme chloroperoxidase
MVPPALTRAFGEFRRERTAIVLLLAMLIALCGLAAYLALQRADLREDLAVAEAANADASRSIKQLQAKIDQLNLETELAEAALQEALTNEDRRATTLARLSASSDERIAKLLSMATAATSSMAASTAAVEQPNASVQKSSSYVTTSDGVQLYYKDWGPKDAPVVVFSHGWPLSSDSWESQMIFLASNGYRVVAHDRRGHGRSSQPWDGNDMDHYADDLASVIKALGLKNMTLVGFSTGGGEVARYIGRHGTAGVRKAVLVSAVTPLMLKTATNQGGLPIEVFDNIRKASLDNRSQLYLDIASGPFFGFNRPGAKSSEGLVQSFWVQGMQAGHKNTYGCRRTRSWCRAA